MIAIISFFSHLAFAHATVCPGELVQAVVTARDLGRRLVYPRTNFRQYINHGDEAKVFAVAHRSADKTLVWAEKIFRRIDDESAAWSAENNARALQALKELEIDGMLAGFQVIQIHGLRGAVLTLDLLEGRDLSEMYGMDLQGGQDTKALRARYNSECREVARRFARAGFGVDVIAPPTDQSEIPLSISFRLPERLSLKIEICTPNVIYTPRTDELVIIDPY